MKAYLHTHSENPNGTRDCFLTRSVECRVDGRWRRVYCYIYSNIGTLFIGKKYTGNFRVQIEG